MSKILAAGDDGSFSDFKIIIASTDGGLTWSKVTTAISDSGWSVVWSEDLGLWVCGADFASGTKQVQTSPDGADGNWTAFNSPADGSGSVRRMVAGSGQVVVAYKKSGAVAVMNSPDGAAWTQQTLPSGILGSNGPNLAYSPDLGLYAVGEFGISMAPNQGAMATSPDGAAWTLRPKQSDTGGDGNVAWGNGIFALLSGLQGSGEHLYTSTDGVTWTQRLANPGGSAQSWQDVAFGNGVFVAVSSDISTNPGHQVVTSTDGINWTTRATPGTGKKWSAVAYDADSGAWIAGDGGFGSTQPLMRSTDNGVTWSLITLGFSYGFMNGIASDAQVTPPAVTVGNIWGGGSGQSAGNHW